MTGCLGSPSYRNSSAATLSGRSAPGSRPIPFPLLYQGIPKKATISIIQEGNRHERYRVQHGHVALRAKHHEKLTKMTRTGTYRFICVRSIRRSNRNLDVAPRERSDAAYFQKLPSLDSAWTTIALRIGNTIVERYNQRQRQVLP